MKITPYTNQELEIKRKKVQDKLVETKSNLKSIRDIAEIKPAPKEIQDGLGINFDKYA